MPEVDADAKKLLEAYLLARMEEERIRSGIDVNEKIANLADELERLGDPSFPVRNYAEAAGKLDALLAAEAARKTGAAAASPDMVKGPEPAPPSPRSLLRLPAPWKALNDELARALDHVIAALKAGGEDAVLVSDCLARGNHPLASPIHSPTTQFAAVANAPSFVEIPDDTAFWSDKGPSDKRNPKEFIQDNYGNKLRDDWHHAGLMRQQLKRDIQLYNAYAAWIVHHPTEKLEFADNNQSGGRPRLYTPEQALERKREQSRLSAARARANALARRLGRSEPK